MLAKSIRLGTVFSLVALLMACGGAEERKADHLQKAMRYLEENNIDKATIEFKNVLQIDPKTPQPYFYLGKINEGRKNWPEAFGFYQKAVELDPNFKDAQLKLAQFLLLAKDIKKAEAMLEAVAKERPNDLDVRMLQIAINNAKGETDKTLADVEKIVHEKPNRADPYIILATLYNQRGKVADAETVLKDGLTVLAENPDLLITLSRLYVTQKKPELAEQAIKRLISAQPGKLPHRVLLSELYMSQERWPDAEQALRTAAKEFPDDPSATLMLIEFLAKRGEVDKAEQELKGAISAKPKEAKLQFAYAQLLDRTGRSAQSEKLLRDFVEESDSKPDVLKAKDLLAAMLYRMGKKDESQELLKEIVKENPRDFDALMLQGRIAMADKRAQDAIGAFRSILKEQPDSTEAMTLLASAFALDGKPQLAQENLDKAVSLKPNDFNVRKAQVEFLVQQKNLPGALEKIDDFLKQSPKSLEGLNLKADVLALNRNREGLEAVLKQMKAEFPNNPMGAFRLGNFYQTEKKYDAALAEFEAALPKASNDYDTLKAIMATYLAMNQPAKAVARIKKVVVANPKHPSAHQLMGALAASQGHTDEAVSEFKLAIEANPRWLVPYANLAEVYERTGQRDPAIEINRKALALAPNDTTFQFNLARIYEDAGDTAKAAEWYESILKTHPNNLLAINNLAAVLSADGSDKDKLKRAMELAKPLEASDQPVFLDTVAWIYYQLGEYEKALPLQVKAVEKRPDPPILQYHLGAIYAKTGNAEKAKEHLGKALQSGKKFDGIEDAKKVLQSL